jgi:hypothetical protein
MVIRSLPRTPPSAPARSPPAGAELCWGREQDVEGVSFFFVMAGLVPAMTKGKAGMTDGEWSYPK